MAELGLDLKSAHSKFLHAHSGVFLSSSHLPSLEGSGDRGSALELNRRTQYMSGGGIDHNEFNQSFLLNGQVFPEWLGALGAGTGLFWSLLHSSI